MKKTLFIFCLTLGLTFALTGCGGGDDKQQADSQQPQKLIAAAEISYAPFEYMEGATAVGFDVDLWQELCKRMGVEGEHQNYSWDGLIPGLQAKKYDVIMSDIGITEERLKQVDFSKPYFKQTFGIAVREDSGINVLEDTKDKIIGIQTGSMAEKWMRDNQEKLGVKQLIPYETLPDAILDLQAGRTSGVVNDKPGLAYLATKSDGVSVVESISFGDEIKIGIAVNKENPELTENINKAIDAVIADGTYAKIYEKWFGFAPAETDMP